jgi:hypothetical protein
MQLARIYCFALPLVLACPTPSQDRNPPLVHVHVGELQELAAQLRTSRLTGLAEDEDMLRPARALIDLQRARSSALFALLEEGIRLDVPLDAIDINNILADGADGWIFDQDLEGIRSVQLAAACPDVNDRGMFFPSTRGLLRIDCTPRHEGRFAHRFEARAQMLATASWLERLDNAEWDDLPIHALRSTEAKPARSFFGPASLVEGICMQHRPGSLLYAFATLKELQHIEPFWMEPRPGFGITCNLVALRRIARAGEPLAALGLDKASWHIGFDGGELLEEFTLTCSDGPTGIVRALLTGHAALPDQPLPDGGLLQIRFAADLSQILDAMETVPMGAPPAIREQIEAAFTGGVAIGVANPSRGNVVPRIFLTIGVQDAEAAERLLLSAFGDATIKEVQIGDLQAKTVEIPDAPAALQPAWLIHGGSIHIADTVQSLRSLVAEFSADRTAMDLPTEETVRASEISPPLASFDLSFDAATAYETYDRTWRRVWELALMGSHTHSIGNLMPGYDIVAEYCRPTRATLHAEGNNLIVSHRGGLGSPVLQSLIAIALPSLLQERTPWAIRHLANAIAMQRLRGVAEAVEAHRKRGEPLPATLPELFTELGLPDNSLEIPYHAQAEQVELADGRTVRVSYRYNAPSGGGHSHDRMLEEVGSVRALGMTEQGEIEDDTSAIYRELKLPTKR